MVFHKKYRVVVGGTRIVILYQSYAIKIARFKLFSPFLRIAQYYLKPKEQNNDATIANALHSRTLIQNAIELLRTMFLYGVQANVREWSRWRETRSTELVPTLFSIGIVNIQRRAQQARPLSPNVLQKAHGLRCLEDGDNDDYPDNRGIYTDPLTGRTNNRWLDYGFRLPPQNIYPQR